MSAAPQSMVRLGLLAKTMVVGSASLVSRAMVEGAAAIIFEASVFRAVRSRLNVRWIRRVFAVRGVSAMRAWAS